MRTTTKNTNTKPNAQLLMTLDYFEHKMWHHSIKMEFLKIANFLDTTSDDNDLPGFITKNWIEVNVQQDFHIYISVPSKVI